MELASLLIRFAAGTFLSLATMACVSDRYAGIDLRPGGAPAEVQSLARAARSGDKHAQLALGDRFAAQAGHADDRAAALYRSAAQDSGGPIQVYIPPVGGSGARIERIVRPLTAGLPEARARLASLSGRSAERPEQPVSTDTRKRGMYIPARIGVNTKSLRDDPMQQRRVATVSTRSAIAASPYAVVAAVIEILGSGRRMSVDMLKQTAIERQRPLGLPVLSSVAFDQQSPCNPDDRSNGYDGVSPEQLRPLCRNGWVHRITLRSNDAVAFGRSDQGELLSSDLKSQVSIDASRLSDLAERFGVELVDVTDTPSFRAANTGHIQADIRGTAIVPKSGASIARIDFFPDGYATGITILTGE